MHLPRLLVDARPAAVLRVLHRHTIAWLIALGIAAAPAYGQSTGTPSQTTGTTPQVISAEQFLVRGMTQAFLDNHDAAIALYQQALTFTPDAASIHAAIAASYGAMDNVADALPYAEEAVALAPEQPGYYLDLSNLYLLAGNGDRAEATLHRLLERAPGDLDALYELAFVQQTIGRPHEAIATYQRIEAATGPALSLKYRQLQLYRELGDEAAMESTLLAMIALDDADITLRRMLGELYIAQGRMGDATRTLERARVLAPQDVDLLVTLVSLYRNGDDQARADSLMRTMRADAGASLEQRLAQARFLYSESRRDTTYVVPAVELLRAIVDSHPDQEEALSLLGDLLFEQGDFRASGDVLYRSLTRNPRSPERWRRAGWAFLQGGQIERAADTADEALLLFPGDSELLRISGFALLEAENNTAAIARFTSLLNKLEGNGNEDAESASDVYAALGLLHARSGDVDRSDAMYDAALARNPDNVFALNNYAYSLAVRGETLNRARQYARRAVDADPQNPAFLDTLAWVLATMERYDEARDLLERAIATRRASAAVHEHYGDVLQKLGEPAQARDAWEKALQMNPDNADLRGKLNR